MTRNPNKSDRAPHKHAPTTTEISNTVTNFDVADLILHNIENEIVGNHSQQITMRITDFMDMYEYYRIGLFEFESTKMKRTVNATN